MTIIVETFCIGGKYRPSVVLHLCSIIKLYCGKFGGVSSLTCDSLQSPPRFIIILSYKPTKIPGRVPKIQIVASYFGVYLRNR